MAQPNVKVEGLREFIKELKAVDPKWAKELQKSNKRAAALVVPEAKSRAGATRTNLKGNPTRAGSKVVGTIRPLATQRAAQVAMGGAKTPWAGGHEWGSSGRYKQFPPANKEGYILWPAAKGKEGEVVELFLTGIDEILKAAFPD